MPYRDPPRPPQYDPPRRAPRPRPFYALWCAAAVGGTTLGFLRFVLQIDGPTPPVVAGVAFALTFALFLFDQEGKWWWY